MSNPTEPETKTVSLRMARASEEDLETAFFIAGLLQDLDEVNRPTLSRTDFPRDLSDLTGESGPPDPDYFDPDDGEHCKIIVNRLIKALNHRPGCMNRVVWGYETLTSNTNQLIDPDADHLAFHPRLENVAKVDPEMLQEIATSEAARLGLESSDLLADLTEAPKLFVKNYSTVSPGYVGPVLIVLWPADPGAMSSFIQRDGKWTHCNSSSW